MFRDEFSFLLPKTSSFSYETSPIFSHSLIYGFSHSSFFFFINKSPFFSQEYTNVPFFTYYNKYLSLSHFHQLLLQFSVSIYRKISKMIAYIHCLYFFPLTTLKLTSVKLPPSIYNNYFVKIINNHQHSLLGPYVT